MPLLALLFLLAGVAEGWCQAILALGGQSTSITTGTDGLGLISYTSAGRLMVAHCANVACVSATTATLDAGGSAGALTSVRVGADGLGLITYSMAGRLKVAHCANAACSSATTATLDGVGAFSALAIGADGLGLISYLDGSNNDLKVAHCANVACSSATTTTLDGPANVGWFTSITIGADGLGLISYFDGSAGALKVAHCANAACSSATLATLDGAGSAFTSITIGADGLGLISYYDRNGGLRVAHCANVACSSATTATLDGPADVGQHSSITIGADGLGLISYYDQGNGDLKVAHCANVACSSATTATLDGPADVGTNTSITIGADGVGLISYYDNWSNRLKVVHCGNVACSAVATYQVIVAKTGAGGGTVTSTSPAGAIDCGATCAANITHGNSVTLAASPAVGSYFFGWSGGGCSGTGDCLVPTSAATTATTTVTADFHLNAYRLTVAKVGTGSGTVTSPSFPGAIDCGATCVASLVYGTSITLSATPASNSVFTGWSGSGCSGTSTCTVPITAVTTVAATFTLATYQLSVVKTGTGVGTVTSTSPAGTISCGAACAASIAHGVSVTLAASPAVGSTFAGWSGGGCSGQGTCTVPMTAATSVTATFTAAPGTYALTVAKAGTGAGVVDSNPAGIACGASCSATFASGTLVTLTATPATGSTFTGWSGGGCEGAGACTVTVTAATAVAATFTLNRYPLTVQTLGGGAVTSVTPPGFSCSGACGKDFDHGTVVTLSATPVSGATFTGWSGACSGTSTCTLTMTQARTVAAAFTEPPPSISATGSAEPPSVRQGTSVKLLVSVTPGTSPPTTGLVVVADAGAVGGSAELALSDTGASGCPDAPGDNVFVTCLTVDMAVASGAKILPVTVQDAQGRSARISITVGIPAFKSYFAEGATSDFFDTTLALLNSADQSASATLTFMRSAGPVMTHTLTAAPHSRVTINPKRIAGLENTAFSTTIEADRIVVADRTMSWDKTGYGAHAETAVAAPATTWYLAEGATHSGFQLFYLVQNPNPTEATVTVEYLLPAPRPSLVRTYPIDPLSRSTIWVNTDPALANTDVSATIASDVPIIVERAMYLDTPTQGFAAGHESAGVTAPATHWFLAEGATGPFFDLFVLMANPGSSDATCDVRFLLPDGTVIPRPTAVSARSRANIWVDAEGGRLADTAVSTTVSCGVPIVVERAMWWPGTGWTEAHNSFGATVTGTKWALAEGEQGGSRSTETYILIANTSPFDGRTRVTLYFEDGTTVDKTVPLTANSRTNVAVGAPPDAGGFGTAVANKRFGAVIESLAATDGGLPPQVVVERAMYSNANGVIWAAGTNAVATKLR